MKNYKPFLILLISLCFVTSCWTPLIQGCAVPSYESVATNKLVPSDISFFPSQFGSDPFLKQYLFQTHWEAHKRSDGDNNQADYDPEPFKTANLREWQQYINVKIETKAIEEVIYKTELKQLEAIKQRVISNQPIPKSPNSFLNYLTNISQLDTLEYLIFAKKCEPFAYFAGWFWDFEEEMKKIRDPQKMQVLIDEGLANYQRTTNPFLKLRYGYQIVRLANYANKSADCIRYYDSLVATLKHESAYRFHALRHKAGAFKKLRKESDFLVYTSLVFDQAPLLMNEAMIEFYLPTPKVWQETLAKAGNNHRKATLWLMWFLKDEGRLNLEPLTQVYLLEPKSSRLEFMLVYYINKLEKALLTSDFFFSQLTPSEESLNYIRDLREFVINVDQSRIRRPALWQMAAGYLSILLKEYETAKIHFDQVEHIKTDDTFTPWLNAFRGLIELAKTDRISEGLETAIAPTLRQFRNYPEQYNNTIIYRSYLILMAQKYFRAGQLAKGFCCIDQTGYGNLATSFLINHCDHQSLERISNYITNPEKTVFDRFLTSNLINNIDDLYYIRGSKYLNEGNYSEALKFLAKIPPSYWNEINQNLINTSFETNYYNPKTGLYRYPKGQNEFPAISKYEFVKKINQLLAAAEKHPDKADLYYYQIANAYFHSGQWSYYMVNLDYYPSFDFSDDNPRYPFYLETFSSTNFNHYYSEWANRKNAWYFYDKAMKVSTNKELAARCCFLAAASQTEFSRQEAFTPEGKGKEYYYQLLAEQYSDTRYYQEVLQECADLSNYLKGKK